MFSVKSVVSNAPLSNAGEVSPGLMTGNPDLLVTQDHQTQCLSNDDAVTRTRTEGKTMGNFRVALADTFEAAFVSTENGEERTARKPEGLQPGLTAACSFGRPGVKHQRDIDNTALDSTHGLKKRKRKPVVNQKFHPCSICGASFDRPSKLARHSIIHTGEQPFRCDDCGRCFNQKSNMKAHKKNHGNRDSYQCDKCNQYFKTSAVLMRHKVFHNDERLCPCTICDLKFTSVAKCKVHMETHQDIRPYKCGKCDKTFKTESTLNHHKNVHKTVRDKYCRYCDASYKSQCALKAHYNKKHPEQQYEKASKSVDDGAVVNGLPPVIDQASTSTTNSAGWPFDQSNKSDADNLHDPASDLIASSQADKQSSLTANYSFNCLGISHKCDICDVLFESGDRLRKHELIHGGTKLHQSSVYDPTSTKVDGIGRHDINTNQQSFECLYCDARFNTKSGFDRHNKYHAAGKLHQCAVCRQCFRTNDNLLKHERLHNPARPYECNICHFRFDDLIVCRRHESTVHDNARLYKCNLCDRKFKTSLALIQHQTVHEDVKKFKCFCGMIYKSRRTLIKHKKDKHPEQLCKTRSINADDGVVISQLSPVIDRSSTSGTCRNDLTAEERFNQLPDKPNEISSGDGESEVPDRSCIESASDTVVDVDKTHKHKKKEITEGSAGKRQHEMSGPLKKQTTNGGVVISQLPPVTDKLSTSTTAIDLMTGEDLDNVLDACLSDLCSADQPSDRLHKSCPDHFYNSAIDPDTDKTNLYDEEEVTVNFLEERQHGMSGSLEEQAVDSCSVANQPLPVINNLPSEEIFDEMIYNYAQNLFDNSNWLPDESG